ncbi:MAG TPA: ferrochelatase [Flavobacteriales bacterium]|nr:ferrochelatase [Flavobacteriales bacterium]
MKTGVLLINLGTPDSPATKDVRRYLTEFLNDPFVIDLPWLKRLLLVNLIIIPFRAPKSAKLYKEIWTDEGSPLLVHGKAVREHLQNSLGDQFEVSLAMRYQNPSIRSVLEKMEKVNYDRIIALPLYPQYASSSTGSTIAKVKEAAERYPTLPPIRFIEHFYDHPTFIKAWVEQFSKHDISSYDHVIFSFHGLPERHLQKESPSGNCLTPNCCAAINEGNRTCYRAHCFATVKAILEHVAIPDHAYSIAFQSRLGSDPWIQPFSDEVVAEKAKEGAKKLLIASPAFVADCLETLYEIEVEYDELFKEHGGEKVELVKCLNENATWIAALNDMVANKASETT